MCLDLLFGPECASQVLFLFTSHLQDAAVSVITLLLLQLQLWLAVNYVLELVKSFIKLGPEVPYFDKIIYHQISLDPNNLCSDDLINI